LKHDTIEPAAKLKSGAQAYVDGAWHKQGEQATLVPVGLPKVQIAKQLAALVEKIPEADRKEIGLAPKYQLLRRKLHSPSLFKYIMCQWLRASTPKAALWRIGIHGKISSQYDAGLIPRPSSHGMKEPKPATP